MTDFLDLVRNPVFVYGIVTLAILYGASAAIALLSGEYRTAEKLINSYLNILTMLLLSKLTGLPLALQIQLAPGVMLVLMGAS
ncbi:MAG TPA: hypothetical protein EYP08_03525 [Pyrodictiaceae archaeon]|nr:hypothetical protein [Pyrodictiaceae archaeon]